MNRFAVVAGAAFALCFAGGAAAQAAYENEVSFFGTHDRMEEPENVTVSIFNLRYGRYLTPQAVATLGIARTRFDTGAIDSTTNAITGGAKYYFMEPARKGIIPFAEAAIGIAHTDTGRDDETDLTWELGGGASFFMTDVTSFDASLRFYQTDTDGGDTEGVRLFVGMTTRF
jgi:hypothetical protein